MIEPASELALGSVIEALGVVVCRIALDPPRTLLQASPTIEALTGHARADLLDNAVCSFASLVHHDDLDRVRAVLADALAHDRPYALEYRLQPRTGPLRWVHEQGRVARDEHGERLGVDSLLFDVTHVAAQRRAEPWDETMRRQQAAVVSLATSDEVAEGRLAQVSEWATEQVATIVEVERVSVWLLNGERTQLELVDLHRSSAKHHEHSGVLSASDYPAYFRALHESRTVAAHDACTDPRTCEFSPGYLRPNGITAMLDATLRSAGDVVGVLCLEHVGGPRVWLDHEIRFAGAIADQLCHALLNRARIDDQLQRERLQEQLFRAQRIEALGRLAGGIAHDFNNLLTIIVGHASMILNGFEPPEDVVEILAAAERGTELTQQLLAFSHKRTLELHDVDLGASVGQLDRMLQRLLGDDIELEFHLPTQPVVVRATEGLLQQVLTNLVVNARDAMPEGGRIHVEVEQVTIREDPPHAVDVLSPGRYARLRVADCGTGIPAELLDRIFEPFFTTKELGRGTGLGLSTVYGIAQRCEGTIAVESTLGRGTRFSMYLPLVERPLVPELGGSPAVPILAFGRGRLVVVIEDDSAVLRLVLRALERVGFVVRGVADPVAGLELLRSLAERRPCLVLSDVVMPGGGGRIMSQWMRTHMPEVPIAFMSGYVETRAHRRVSEHPLIAKPFTAAQLYDCVQTLLGE